MLDKELYILELQNELSEKKVRNYILERDAESDITLAEENEEIIEGLCDIINEKDEYIKILEDSQEELFAELDGYDEVLAKIIVIMKDEYGIDIDIEFLDEKDCDEDCDNCENNRMFGVIH